MSERWEKPDRERVLRVEPAPAEEFPAGVCGSCFWNRSRLQFGTMVRVCVVMPKQVMAVTQGIGAQVLSMNPVIENQREELCAMWKPLTEDTQ